MNVHLLEQTEIQLKVGKITNKKRKLNMPKKERKGTSKTEEILVINKMEDTIKMTEEKEDNIMIAVGQNKPKNVSDVIKWDMSPKSAKVSVI